MKYIIQKKPGKVSVRHHTRHLEYGNTNVVDHSRSRPTSRRGVRETIGRIPLKDMNWQQAKRRMPFLEPRGDLDEDGVVNKRDCKPFDAMRQDDDDEELFNRIDREMEEYPTGRILEEGKDFVIINPDVLKAMTPEEHKIWKEGTIQEKIDMRQQAGDRFFEKKLLKEKEESERFLEAIEKRKILRKEEELKKNKPYIDSDGDGVLNKFDCHPADPTRQHLSESPQARKSRLNKAIKEMEEEKFNQEIIDNYKQQLAEVERAKLEKEMANKQLAGRQILNERMSSGFIPDLGDERSAFD
jgi:hypothetical protein